jgi:2-dehydropantoate 2-reductase
MTVFVPATYLEPGIVQTEARTTTGILDIGCYPSGVDDTSRFLTEALSRSGFDCRAAPDVMRWKHAKLLGNLRNALGALCDEKEQTQRVAELINREALDSYRAAGIEWASKEEVAKRHGSILELGTVDGKPRPGSSSWQSIARAAGSIETDFLNGEIVLLGRLYGIPTPANATLQELANRMVREDSAPGRYSAEQLETRIVEAGGRL